MKSDQIKLKNKNNKNIIIFNKKILIHSFFNEY